MSRTPTKNAARRTWHGGCCVIGPSSAVCLLCGWCRLERMVVPNMASTRWDGTPGTWTTPSTSGTTPSTLGTTPSTLGTTPSTLGTTRSTLGTTPSTLGTRESRGARAPPAIRLRACVLTFAAPNCVHTGPDSPVTIGGRPVLSLPARGIWRWCGGERMCGVWCVVSKGQG